MDKDCLAAAIRLKKDEGMYSCGFCSVGFADKLDLLAHMKLQHAVSL